MSDGVMSVRKQSPHCPAPIHAQAVIAPLDLPDSAIVSPSLVDEIAIYPFENELSHLW